MGGITNIWHQIFKGGEHSEPQIGHPGDYQWDPETGLPIGLNGPPPAGSAGEFQWHSDELIAQRKALLRRQAMDFLRQGQRVFESYRPGGAASLAAGTYRDMANASFASMPDQQDLLFGFREEQAKKALSDAQAGLKLQNAGDLLNIKIDNGDTAMARLGQTQQPSAPGQTIVQAGGATSGPGSVTGIDGIDRGQSSRIAGGGSPQAQQSGQSPLQSQRLSAQDRYAVGPVGQQGSGGQGRLGGPGAGGVQTQQPAGGQRAAAQPAQQVAQQPMSGRASAGLDPIGPAMVLHYETFDDGFYESVNRVLNTMLVDRMNEMAT